MKFDFESSDRFGEATVVRFLEEHANARRMRDDAKLGEEVFEEAVERGSLELSTDKAQC